MVQARRHAQRGTDRARVHRNLLRRSLSLALYPFGAPKTRPPDSPDRGRSLFGGVRKAGGAGQNRTGDLAVRNRLLYPTELQPHQSVSNCLHHICTTSAPHPSIFCCAAKFSTHSARCPLPETLPIGPVASC